MLITRIDQAHPQPVQVDLRVLSQPEQLVTLGRKVDRLRGRIELPGTDLRDRVCESQTLLTHGQRVIRPGLLQRRPDQLCDPPCQFNFQCAPVARRILRNTQ